MIDPAAQGDARAELARDASHSLLAAALESTADGILVTDLERRITAWNRRFQELFGVSDELMASRDLGRVFGAVAPRLCDAQQAAAGVEALYADALLRNADLAMYHAKQEGRNNVQFYSHDMSERTAKRVDLVGRLRGAIERSELLLHYQPQVDVRGGGILGVEALLRWNDPERGLVPPGQFIPLAEDSGLIVPIGEWVLREACGQAKRWLDAGLGPLTMAVNLSPRQFRQKNLVESIAAILAGTGLPPDCLDLEITESTVMHRTEEAAANLHALHRLGVRISLDDFGTGYSSLAYLHRFPVHTLKVDQSFVRDIKSDRDAAAIVSTVITLAKQLKLKALAEGVETEAQLAFLRAHGCDAFQGYLFCRPKPAADIEALLRHHRARFAAPAAKARAGRRKPAPGSV